MENVWDELMTGLNGLVGVGGGGKVVRWRIDILETRKCLNQCCQGRWLGLMIVLHDENLQNRPMLYESGRFQEMTVF